MLKTQRMGIVLASAALLALCTVIWAHSNANGENSASAGRVRPSQILFEVVSSTN